MMLAAWHAAGASVARQQLPVADDRHLRVICAGRAALAGEAGHTSEHGVWAGTLLTPLPRDLTLDSATDLRGNFACIASFSGGLMLVRSHFGGHALYYARFNDAWLVSSHLEPLARHLGRNALSVDVDRLAAIVAAQDLPDLSRTVFREIARVPSGSCVRLTADGITTTRAMPLKAAQSERISAEEAAEELRCRISTAISRSTRTARTVAVFASGGLDSSGVLASLLAQTKKQEAAPQVHALTLDFGGQGDDRPYLKTLEGALGFAAIRVPPSDGVRVLRAALVVDAAPDPSPNAANSLSLMNRARDVGADVVLTGIDGDGVFGADTGVLARRLLRAPVGSVMAAWRLQTPWSSTPYARLRDLLVRPVVRRLLPSATVRVRRARAVRRSERWSWAGPRLRAFLDSTCGQPAFDSSLQAIATGGLLMDAAEGRAAHECMTGLRRVDVYLEPEVTEFVASLPPELLLHGNHVRGLYRLAMRGVLPDLVRLRADKASHQGCIDDTMAAGGLDACRPLLDLEHLAALGIVEPIAFRRALRRYETDADRRRNWLVPWPAIAAEAFVRAYDDGTLFESRPDAA